MIERLATYDDLLALPEDSRGEVVCGELVVTPSPTPIHQSVVGEFYAELRGPFQHGRGGPGGWWLIQDVDAQLGPHDIYRSRDLRLATGERTGVPHPATGAASSGLGLRGCAEGMRE